MQLVKSYKELNQIADFAYEKITKRLALRQYLKACKWRKEMLNIRFITSNYHRLKMVRKTMKGLRMTRRINLLIKNVKEKGKEFRKHNLLKKH